MLHLNIKKNISKWIVISVLPILPITPCFGKDSKDSYSYPDTHFLTTPDVGYDTSQVKNSKGEILDIDSLIAREILRNRSYAVHFRDPHLKLKEAERIVREYKFLLTSVSYSRKDIPLSEEGVLCNFGPPFDETITDFLESIFKLDVKNYANEIEIKNMHCALTDYSKLEEMVFDNRFIMPGGAWTNEERTASEYLYEAKDALKENNYKISIKSLIKAINYMYTTKEYEDSMLLMIPDGDFKRKNITQSLLMVQSLYILGKSYESIGDNINSTKAYEQVIQHPKDPEKTRLVKFLKEKAQEAISRISSN